MSDERLRSLQRDPHATDEDRVRILRERWRAGDLAGRVRFEALAQLGDAWAFGVLGLSERPDVPEFGTRRGALNRNDEDPGIALLHDVRRVRTVSHEAVLRACVAACRPIKTRPESAVFRSGTRQSDRLLHLAERRLQDAPRTWAAGWLYEHDRDRWHEQIDMNHIGTKIDAWAMCLYGFDDDRNWSGARCVLLALHERHEAHRMRPDALVRSDMIRELRAWALSS